MFRKSVIAVALSLCAAPGLVQAQTLTSLTHPAPEGALITLQLTDGTVMAQSASNQSNWWKLTPDNTYTTGA